MAVRPFYVNGEWRTGEGTFEVRNPYDDSLVAEMQRGGGIITKADLAAYRPKWREPIRVEYRGYAVYSMPPSSSGGVTLAEILNILGGYDSLPPFGSTALLHLETEAMRRAFEDRNHWLGDPDFVQMPLDRLLSKSYAAELRAQIDPTRATPTPPFQAGPPGSTETTHYSIVDADGNAASVTTTLNNSYGSAVTVTGAGFLLNDEMDDFATAPGKPNMFGLVQGEVNAVAPGKRMLSAMTPTIVLDPAGRLFLVAGAPGGPRIITAVYHVISNVIDHHMSLAQAIESPRGHHQALPDTLTVERGGFTSAVLDSLRFGEIAAPGAKARARGDGGGGIAPLTLRPKTQDAGLKSGATPDEMKANRRILDGVIRGIGHYGNCFGVPTIGGECVFEPGYNGNPLVNVFCLGLADDPQLPGFLNDPLQTLAKQDVIVGQCDAVRVHRGPYPPLAR